MRELVWMANARIDQTWNHTASVLAMLVNIHRDPRKGRALKPADFHPALIRKNSIPLPADITVLKALVRK